MTRFVRGLGVLVAVVLAAAAVCALAGALYAHFRGGTTYAHAIGWAMWVGGGLLVMLVGLSGSTTRMAGESRIVVGGRFVEGSDIPQPQSPWIVIPAGVLVILLGVLVYAG